MHALIAAALFTVIASSPTWSPDGDSIAFAQRVGDESSLVVAGIRRGDRRVVARDAYSPRWSPATDAIAYLAPEEQSGNVVQLRIADVALFGHGNYAVADGVSGFAWSPLGDELYYDEGSLTCGRIHAVSAYDLTRRRVVVTGASPLPSPDGKQIAYLSAIHGTCTGGFGTMSVANVDGTAEHLVFDGPVIRAAWSPDGKRLAIESWTKVTEPTITVVGADGSNPHVVAVGTRPAWSPDGRELAYLSVPLVDAPFPRDEPYLQVVDLATGVERPRLLTASAENGGPAWSPNGEEIALSRALERGGRTEGLAAGLNRSVSVYAVQPNAPAKARRISFAACELLTPRCTLAGGPGGNVLVGTTRRDVIWGYGGDDRIAGGSGDDALRGGSGDDVLTGGAGRDVITGGSGGDVVFARDGRRDAVYCGSGYDIVLADRTDDVSRDCDKIARL